MRKKFNMYTTQFWPTEKSNFENDVAFRINQPYTGNYERDFKWLADNYYVCGKTLLNKCSEEELDYDFKENVAFVGIFMIRHSIELTFKSMIHGQYNHNLATLYLIYLDKESNSKTQFLNNNEKKWLKSYFNDLEKYDKKGDYIRYPSDDLERDEHNGQKGNHIDLEKTIENLNIAYNISKKAIGDKFDQNSIDTNNCKRYIVFEDNYNSTHYIYAERNKDKYSRFVQQYLKSFEFLYNCETISDDCKALPMMFTLNHTIELSIKEIIEQIGALDKKFKTHDFDNLYDTAITIIDEINAQANNRQNTLNSCKSLKEDAKHLLEDEKMYRYPVNKDNKYYFANNSNLDFSSTIISSLKLICFFNSCSEQLEEYIKYSI